MSKIEPLTVKGREMVEQYHYLVADFLQRKRLAPNQYYDIVIFGYLQAIQRECRNSSPLPQKNICGLIEICMNRAVLQEWRRQYQIKRTGDRKQLSLDRIPAHTDDDELSLYAVIADTQQNIETQVEARDLIERIFAVATPREREALELACLGYKTHEIAQMLGIAQNTASRTLYNLRVKAKALRDGREVIRCPQWANEKTKRKKQAYNRAYRQAHQLEINAKARIQKQACRSAHPEETHAKDRAYYAAHREEICARKRARNAAKRAEKQVQEKNRPQCCEHQGRQEIAATP